MAAGDRAYELDPGDARTAVFRARMRQGASDVEGAFSVLVEFLERSPDAGMVRMAYARMLVDAGATSRRARNSSALWRRKPEER